MAVTVPEGSYAHLSNGMDLHYLEFSPTNVDAPTAVFIHGSGPGASGWSNFKQNTEAFCQAGYRAIIIDIPGYGYTSKPTDAIYSLDFFTQYLDEFMVHKGINRAVLVGNSLGGAIAVGYALEHPDKVSHLILMATGGVEEREVYFATQGIQAQTISNLYLAIENNLEIIPVINKIDMDGAMIEEVEDQIVDLIGCKREDILHASGRTGLGVEKVLSSIVDRIPAPKGKPDAPLQALIFDSVFNSFRGIIVYYRILNGSIKKGDRVKFVSTDQEYEADEVGILKLKMTEKKEVKTGDVGYIITGIKNAKEVKVGDTITLASNPTPEQIKGF